SNPTLGQLDDFAPSLKQFYEKARQHLSSADLCGTNPIERCEHLIAALDAWNGHATIESFEVSVIAQWFEQWIVALWPKKEAEDVTSYKELRQKWKMDLNARRVALSRLDSLSTDLTTDLTKDL